MEEHIDPYFDFGRDGTMRAKTWNVHAWPIIYILDVEGKIRFKWDWKDAKTLDSWIESLLIEAGETPPEKGDH